MSEATSEDTTASASHDPTPAISRTPSIDDNTKRYVFFALVTQLLTFPRMIEIFSSQPFTFVVGPDQTEFVVHSKLLERLSQPLHNLMNNGIMTESIKGIAYLDDIDSETFLEFVDFAYAFASISDTALEEEEGYVGWWWCGSSLTVSAPIAKNTLAVLGQTIMRHFILPATLAMFIRQLISLRQCSRISDN